MKRLVCRLMEIFCDTKCKNLKLNFTKETNGVPNSPHSSIAPPVVADKPTTFAQRIADLLGPATIPGPIVGKLFKKSVDISPQVLTTKDTPQSREENNSVNPALSKSDATKISNAEAVTLKPAPPIKFSDIQAGDIIFKVASPESASIYMKIANGQESQVAKFCHNQDKLPVLAKDVVHCDIAIGNGQIAKVGGPHGTKEWLAKGRQTPSQILPLSDLEGTTEDYIVMRSKNKKVAGRMAEKAKETAEKPVTYDIPGLMTSWLFHDRGVQELPLLKEGEQGPQVSPLEIPESMICSQFAGNMVMDGEREAIREDRSATTESINRTKLGPSELIDSLAASGNYDMFMVDQSGGNKEPKNDNV